MCIFKKIYFEEEGVTVIEYAIIAGLLAIAAVITMSSVGSSLNEMYNSVSEAFPD